MGPAARRRERWLLQRTKCRPAALATRTESRGPEIRTAPPTSIKPGRLFCLAARAMATAVAAPTAYAARSLRGRIDKRSAREAGTLLLAFWIGRTPSIRTKAVLSESKAM